MVHAVLDEEQTEFNPGSTKYTVDVFVPDQEPISIVVVRNIVDNKLTAPGKNHPKLVRAALQTVENYIAAIYCRGDY